MTVSNFYKGIFGTKAYKISVSAGCTCPNRDGKIGFGGCIFCSQAGSGDFVPDSFLDIEKQIETQYGEINSAGGAGQLNVWIAVMIAAGGCLVGGGAAVAVVLLRRRKKNADDNKFTKN